MTYISNLDFVESAAIDSTSKNIVIKSADTGADSTLSVTFDISDTGFSASLTDAAEDANDPGKVTKSATGEDGFFVEGIPADLADVLQSAELGEDGTIILTAKDAGKETFDVSSVKLDYEGVKQIATISLEDAAKYLALTDGTFMGSNGRGADVYFAGGQVHADINVLNTDGTVAKTVTVSVDMAPKLFVELDVPNGATLESEVAGGKIDVMVGDSAVETVAVGSTVKEFLANLESLSTVSSATLVGDEIVVEAVGGVGAFTLVPQEDNLKIGVNAGGTPNTFYSMGTPLLGTAADNREVPADTAKALAQAIQAEIDGTPAKPAKVVFEGDYAADDLLYTFDQDRTEYSYGMSGSIVLDGVNVFSFIVSETRSPFLPSAQSNGYDTIGQLVAALDEVEGVRAEIDGSGNIVVQATSDVSSIAVTLAGGTGTDLPTPGEEKSASSEAAIPGELSGVLGAVSLDGTTLTLEAAEVGSHVFSVADVRLDYEGVKQIATVDFGDLGDTSDTPITYFDGGKLEIKVQENLADGTVGDVQTISADMKAEDGEATITALVDAIEAAINPVATVSVGEGISLDDQVLLVNTEVDKSKGITFDLYYDADGDLSTTEDYVRKTVSLYATDDDLGTKIVQVVKDPNGTFQTTRVDAKDADSWDLGTFIDWLNTEAQQAGKPLPVTFSVSSDGELVMTSREVGGIVGLKITEDEQGNIGVVDDGSGGYVTGAAPDADLSFLSSVSENNGVITLTSVDNVSKQFTVTAATASDPARVEITEVSFSIDNADYFATGSDSKGTAGQVSVTVGEGDDAQTFTADMVEDDALATADALLAKMEATEGGLDSTFASVELDVTFTGTLVSGTNAKALQGNIERDLTSGAATLEIDPEELTKLPETYNSVFVSEFSLTFGGNSHLFKSDTAFRTVEDFVAAAQAFFQQHDTAFTATYDETDGTVVFDGANAITGGSDSTFLTFGEREISDIDFIFTGAVVNEALNVSATASVDAVKQVTKIDFGGGFDDSAFIGGIGRDVTVTVAGQEFTIDGSTRLELLQDLEAKLKAAIDADAEGTGEGISAVLDADGISIDEGDSSTAPSMTLTALYGAVDPLGVSALERETFDINDPGNVTQQLQIGLSGSYLKGLVAGETLTLELGATSASYTVLDGDTLDEVVSGIVTALQNADFVKSAEANLDSPQLILIDIEADYPGPDVLGTVESGQDNTITLLQANGDVVEVTTGFLVDQTREGVIVLGPDTETVATPTSSTAGVDLVVADENEVTTTTTQAAKAQTDETVEYTNAGSEGEGVDSTFFGDEAIGVDNVTALQTEDAPYGDHVVFAEDGGGIIALGPIYKDDEGSIVSGNLTDLGEGTAFVVKNASDVMDAENSPIQDTFPDEFGNDEIVVRLGAIGSGNTLKVYGFTLGDSAGRGDVLRILDVADGQDLLAGISSIELAKNLTDYSDIFQNKEFLSFRITTQDGAVLEFVDAVAADVAGPVLSLIAGDGKYGDPVLNDSTPVPDLDDVPGRFVIGEFALSLATNVAYGREGIAQTFTNPDSGYAALNNSPSENKSDNGEGDDTFYGDADQLVGDGDDGIAQTFTNPDDGYTAIDGSPQLDDEDAGEGNGDFFGSDPGYYDDEGLWTSYLNGGTLADPAKDDGEGNDLYDQLDGEDLDRINVGDGSAPDDGGVSGENDGPLDLDGDDISGVDGFAPFDWDESDLTILSEVSTGADIINNFQVGGLVDVEGDRIALEGLLAESTLEGQVDLFDARNTTAVPMSSDVAVVSTGMADVPFTKSLQSSMTFSFDLESADSPFTLDGGMAFQSEVYVGGVRVENILFVLDVRGGEQFESVSDFMDQLNAGKQTPIGGQYTDSFSLNGSWADGKLTITPTDASGALVYSLAGEIGAEISSVSFDAPDMDLSTAEFGLVSSDDSDGVDVANADAVAALLSSVFDLSATTDNGALNTTIFAVTASEDASATAIWAHTQSSSGDDTVEAEELNLLATVDTTGGEFSADNLAIWDGTSFQQPILQSQDLIT